MGLPRAPGGIGSQGSGGRFRWLRQGLQNLLFGGLVLNLARGQFGQPITGSGTGEGGQQGQRPTREQVGPGPPGMEMPRRSTGQPDQGQQAPFRRFGPHGPSGRPVRQLPALPSIAPPGTGIPDFTGPPNPSLPQRTGPGPGEGRTSPAQPTQELEQFTFPEGNVLKFTAGSAPARALNAVVNTIVGSSIPAADIYGVIGVGPEDSDAFMEAVTLRWQEAMAASFGDPDAAADIFSAGLVTEATPVPAPLTEAELIRQARGFDFGGATPTAAGANDEFDPADFTIDPGLLYSSETSGEDFF